MQFPSDAQDGRLTYKPVKYFSLLIYKLCFSLETAKFHIGQEDRGDTPTFKITWDRNLHGTILYIKSIYDHKKINILKIDQSQGTHIFNLYSRMSLVT